MFPIAIYSTRWNVFCYRHTLYNQDDIDKVDVPHRRHHSSNRYAVWGDIDKVDQIASGCAQITNWIYILWHISQKSSTSMLSKMINGKALKSKRTNIQTQWSRSNLIQSTNKQEPKQNTTFQYMRPLRMHHPTRLQCHAMSRPIENQVTTSCKPRDGIPGQHCNQIQSNTQGRITSIYMNDCACHMIPPFTLI